MGADRKGGKERTLLGEEQGRRTTRSGRRKVIPFVHAGRRISRFGFVGVASCESCGSFLGTIAGSIPEQGQYRSRKLSIKATEREMSGLGGGCQEPSPEKHEGQANMAPRNHAWSA